LENLGKESCLWLSHGAFNHIVAVNSDGEAEAFVRGLDVTRIRWEMWTVQNGVISEAKASKPIATIAAWRKALSELKGARTPAEFPHILDEYKALLASSLTRAAQVYPIFEEDLLNAHSEVVKHLRRRSRPGQDKTRTLLVDLNAALSRFASQAFSGASPIHETECHFWTHSLLGTAVPLIALRRIRSFLLETLGEYRIPDRVSAFAKVTADLPELPSGYFNKDIWEQDWLMAAGQFVKRRQSRLLRQVVYLSGRDGFKTTESTLSAPLSTITSCNSERWSLLTITHEVSHTILHSVLSTLLPSREDIKDGQFEIQHAVALYLGKRKPENLLMLLRQYLLRAIDGLDAVHEFSPLDKEPQDRLRSMDPDRLKDLIDRRLEEVEELLVHSFDFIYFYGSDIRRYIVSIWKSWQSIPQLDTKVREYLLRTLATAATKHLGDSDPCGRARKDVESCLKRVSAVLGPRSYATAGLAVLQKEWSSKLEIETAARVLVTQLVPAFLQGPEALAAVRHYFSKPSRRSSDSTFQDLAFVGDHISNPLEFIEQHTRAEADVHRSFWMLHRLAFEAIDTVV